MPSIYSESNKNDPTDKDTTLYMERDTNMNMITHAQNKLVPLRQCA